MSKSIFYIAGNQKVLQTCSNMLTENGAIVAKEPDLSVTHLILPIPSFNDDGTLKYGGNINDLLYRLPKDITIIGGNLPSHLCSSYKTFDLLKDPQYVAENAYITACCALRIIMMELPVILRNCNITIIGWGRIAQCLSSLLKAVDANITVAIRNDQQRALATALGYRAIPLEQLPSILPFQRVICNTAPEIVIQDAMSDLCCSQCLKLDLASKQGICGKNTLWARGLPGKDAPETSGKLIAETIERLIRQEVTS